METLAQCKPTRLEVEENTDMSVEAEEYKHVLDKLNSLLGASNLWDYLPALRWFDVLDVKSIFLATGIISDTLCLYPVVPPPLPHESSTDCEVGGSRIPSGMMVLVNVAPIHRDRRRYGRSRVSSSRRGSRTADATGC
ncbi:hypothetical protein ABZP36_018928 [Zizania latifolia]